MRTGQGLIDGMAGGGSERALPRAESVSGAPRRPKLAARGQTDVMTDHISWRLFRESEGVEDWRNLSDGSCAMFRTASFAESIRFVAAMGELPGVDDHPPRIDIRHDGVTVQLLTVTETYDGMTRRDLDLARAISALARTEGITADPSAVQSLLIIPGAPPGVEVAPFWRAVLGYKSRPDAGLMDPHRRGPALWVEQMHEARADGDGALHLAIWIAYEEAEARVVVRARGGWANGPRPGTCLVDPRRRRGERGRHRHDDGPGLRPATSPGGPTKMAAHRGSRGRPRSGHDEARHLAAPGRPRGGG